MRDKGDGAVRVKGHLRVVSGGRDRAGGEEPAQGCEEEHGGFQEDVMEDWISDHLVDDQLFDMMLSLVEGHHFNTSILVDRPPRLPVRLGG